MNEERLDPSTHLSPVSATSCSSQLASSNSCKCSFTSASSTSPSSSSSHRAPRRVKCTTRNMYQATSAISIVIVLTLGVLYTFSSPVNAFQGNIRFQNNGYSGITVSFQPEIDYSIQGTLIVELQNIFKKASEMLSVATGGRAYFKQVNFLIPINWQGLGLGSLPHLTVKKTRTMTVDDGHLIVKKPEQAFTDNPMTIQLAGCGKPGLQIQLSTKFMTDASHTIEERSKILLSNWVKYRYGVFDEHGFIGDAMYPLYWKTPGAPDEQVEKITSCAAHSPNSSPLASIRTVNQTSSGAPCTLKTNPLTGLPERTDRNGECIALPDTSSNGDIVTSLLSHPALPSVKYFCTEASHNDKAPNKQNTLCEGQSISQVINRHPDFQQQQQQQQQSGEPQQSSSDTLGLATFNTTPTFTILKEEPPMVAFIIDVEAKSSRKKSIANALSRFTQSLTLGLRLAVLDMKDSRETHRSTSNKHVTWMYSNEMVKSPIWGKETASPICLRCVINTLHSSFREDEEASHIIIVTEGKLTDSYTDLDHIASIVNAGNILLKLAIFPYTREDESKNHYDGIKYLMSKVERGSIHLISPSTPQVHSHLFDTSSSSSSSSEYFLSPGSHNSIVSDDRSASLQYYLKLCDFFDSIFPNRNILLSRQIFHPTQYSMYESNNSESSSSNSFSNSINSGMNNVKVREEINFSFNLDNSLAESNINLMAQFLSTDTSEEFEGPTYRLVGPNGATYQSKSREFSLSIYSTPHYDVRLNQAITGNWTLKHSRQNVNSTFVGVAYARVSGTKRFPISGKCIVSQQSEQDDSPPVLYVMVSQDSSQFVQNALVTVTLTDDLGRPLPGAYDLPLFDDGLATPDITQGDGIYSRYLTETSTGGFYGVLVKIRSNGSTVLHEGSTDEKGVECCGSTVPRTTRDTVPVSHLERMLDCGFIHVEKAFNAERYAERVTDLQIYQVDTDNRRVTVTWTRPSLSYDKMELKFFRSNEWPRIRDQFDSFGTFVTQWSTHLPSSNNKDVRERSTHIFNVTDPSEGIYYAAIKVNTKGYATISNVATFYMPIDPTYKSPGSFQALNTPLLWVICLATVMAAVIFIICVICCCSSRKRKNPKDSHLNSASNGGNSTSNTNNVGKHKNAYTNAVNGALHSSLTIQTTMGSSDDLTHEKSTPSSHTALNSSHHMIHSHLNNHKNSSTHDLHGSSDIHHHQQQQQQHHHHHQQQQHQLTQAFNLPVDGTANTISPIQYWSAGVLLGHYHDVKQARERNEPPPVMKIEKILPDAGFTNLTSHHITNSGSSSTGSDNHTGESGSYDESGYHGLTSSNHASDPWRYELAQPAVAQYYSHYSYPAGVYTHQQQQQQQQQQQPGQQQQQDQVIPVTSATYYDANGAAINAMSIWQEPSVYPISIAPPSESASESGDVRYTVPGQRRSTTVSQV